MEKVITGDQLDRFAYCNEAFCQKPVRGVALCFYGLGVSQFFTSYEPLDALGRDGILALIPYTNPWSWMNRQAVAYTDELLDAVFAHYQLDPRTPIVLTGSSMGGQSALVYAANGARRAVACVVNCPVCDLTYQYTFRNDMARTMYSALGNEPGTMEQALRSLSPLHLVDRMPDIDYHLFHCTADALVRIDAHSEKFVAAMQQRGARVTFTRVPDRDHCDLDEAAAAAYDGYIRDAVAAHAVL